MANQKYPSDYIPGLPPKDGKAYRIFWDDTESSASTTMSTLCYSPAGWVRRTPDERWIEFKYVDRVLAHKPEPLE